jgi:prophage DNA circulation protein
MAWQDELVNGSFRDVSFGLDIKTLKMSGGKKGGVNEIPQTDSGTPQDIGNRSRSREIELFFIGDDYKERRDAFLTALDEKGPGDLVLPTETFILKAFPIAWTSVENINERGGEVRFNVTFNEVVDEESPRNVPSDEEQIDSSLDDSEDNVNLDMFNNVDYDLPFSFQQAQKDYQRYSNLVDDQIKKIVDNELLAEFEALQRIIDSSVSDLIRTDVLALSASYTRLTRFPGKIIDKFSNVKEAYSIFIDGLFASFDNTLSNDVKKNQAAQIEAFSTGAFIGLVESGNNASYTTRDEVNQAIDDLKDISESIQTQLGAFEDLFDDQLSKNQYRQSENTGLARANLLAQILSSLNRRAFELSNEKTVILSIPKSLLMLSWELLGDIERIDELIELNEIIDPTLIPAGTRLKYYE